MAENPWSIPNGVTGNERKALQALFDAMKNAQQSIPPEALAQLQFGNVDAFMKMIDWTKIDLSFDDVRKIIEEQAILSARDVFEPTQIDAELLFNRIDERAVQWAKEQSASLVRNITSEFRESIRSTISDGLAGNLTVRQMASRIKQNLPLLPRDRGAVDNFRKRTFERFMQGGMSEEKAREKADAKAERYANKLTRRRAQTIARTEMVSASNAGKYAGWEAGIEGGYIDPDSRKEWIAEPDACEICAPLDGKPIPWNAEFPDLGVAPPAHPNCRCTVAMLPPDYDSSEWEGTPSESPAYDQQTTAVDPNSPEPTISPELKKVGELYDITDPDELQAEFNKVYGSEEFAGIKADVFYAKQIKRNTREPGVTIDELYIRGNLTDSITGEYAGSFERTFKRGIDNVLYVDHDLLEISKGFRGKGFGTSFSNFSERWYRASGVDRIGVSASMDDGAYTWAKAGFQWAEKPTSVIKDIRSKFKGIIDRDSIFHTVPQNLHGEVIKKSEALWETLNNGDYDSPDYPTPFEIANLQEPKINGEPFGKWLLYQSDWLGVKKL